MNQHDPDPEPPGGRSPDNSRSGRPGLAQWLIHQAARSAPEGLSERLEEEWLADLASRETAVSRLRLAVGCCWATRVIASEHCAAAVAVVTPASGTRLSIPLLAGDLHFFPRNSLAVIAVIAFHIAIFYALLAGLGIQVTQFIPTSFQTHIVPEAKPDASPPALPHPTIASQVLRVPPPEIPPLTYPSDPTDVVPQSTDAPPPTGVDGTTVHEVRRVDGGPGAGFPVTDDFYPSAAKRLEEQGITTVRVCVNPGGRLTAAPTVVQSSGFPRLDDGALQLAKAGSGHYRASTEDGRAVDSCYAYRIRFQLKN